MQEETWQDRVLQEQQQANKMLRNISDWIRFLALLAFVGLVLFVIALMGPLL